MSVRMRIVGENGRPITGAYAVLAAPDGFEVKVGPIADEVDLPFLDVRYAPRSGLYGRASVIDGGGGEVLIDGTAAVVDVTPANGVGRTLAMAYEDMSMQQRRATVEVDLALSQLNSALYSAASQGLAVAVRFDAEHAIWTCTINESKEPT